MDIIESQLEKRIITPELVDGLAHRYNRVEEDAVLSWSALGLT